MEGVVGAGGADGVDCDGVRWGDGMGVVTVVLCGVLGLAGGLPFCL